MTIIGIAVILGIVIPDFARSHPADTGIDEIDQMLNILLQIKMFVGGLIAFVLDNVVPGATTAQRGLEEGMEPSNGSDNEEINRYEDCGTPMDGYSFSKRINE